MASRLELKISGKLLFRFYTNNEWENSNIPDRVRDLLFSIKTLNSQSIIPNEIECELGGDLGKELLNE